MKVGLVALHYSRLEHRDEMISRVPRAAGVMAAVPGCLAVDCWVSEDGEAVVTTGQWESEQALAAGFAAVRTAGVNFNYDERESHNTSPVQRVTRGRRQHKDASQFAATMQQPVALAEELTSSVRALEFDAAVKLLAGRPRSALITGGYLTRHLAALLAPQLDQIMTGSRTRRPLTFDINKYLAMRKDGLAIIFDFRRYEEAAPPGHGIPAGRPTAPWTPTGRASAPTAVRCFPPQSGSIVGRKP